MHKYSHFLLASLPIASILLTASPAVAQDDQSKISITPVTFDLSANPGNTLDEAFKVRNDSASTQQVSIQAENFTAVGEKGQVGLTDEDTPYALAKWISFNQSNFTLKAGEEKIVPFLIRVPGNAEPGGHYASVFAYIGPTSASGSSGSGIGQKIGSLILLRVAGDVKESAVVESFKVGSYKAGEDVPFEIRIRNTGSVHIRPQGFVSINDAFSKKVADVQVSGANVFPDAIRQMSTKWEEPGFIGRYTANLLMYYGQNNQQLTATTVFWVIPWMTLAIWGGVAAVVILILFFGRKRIGRSVKALVSGK